MNDGAFNYGILEETGHRPWPVPSGPWVMTQTWHDLLFAHWPVDAAALRALVPSPLELDTFGGQAWVGIVPFHMRNVGLRYMPLLPRLSAFPELNVRTYVRSREQAGVYFFSLDAANPLAVIAARMAAHLPYFTADMEVRVDLSTESVTYRSSRTGGGARQAELVAWYRPSGAVQPPAYDTLEHFLTERYCLFTLNRRRTRTLRIDVHHPPWPLRPAEAELRVNTMASAAGITLPEVPPLLHFSKRQDVVVWWPTSTTVSPPDASR